MKYIHFRFPIVMFRVARLLRQSLVSGHIFAMAPIASVYSSDDDSEREEFPVITPKGKHLWCQVDSYGYTKGKLKEHSVISLFL